TTLGRIAETVVEFVAADPELQAAGVVFEISNHDQRRDLVHAVRLLLRLGLLRRIDGDEQQFLNRTGPADVLYEIDRAILTVMLNVPFSPSALEAMGTRGQTARPVNIRTRLVRALLDDPVLYFDELNPEERTYFEQHRAYLLHQIREAAGLLPEIRHEGVA